MNLLLYALRRVAISIPILLVGTFLAYLMVAGAGDPLADLRVRPGVNPETLATAAHELGLDKPLVARYFDWLTGFVTGDWGVSIAQGAASSPVFPKVMSAFGVTFKLVIGAELLAVLLGVAVGVLAAVKQYSVWDYISTTVAFLMFSMPIFCVAIVLKYYAIQINVVVRDLGLTEWLGNPFLRTSSPENLQADDLGEFLVKYVGAYLLPTLSIMVISFAAYSRFQRASMLETLNTDYVRTARAKGLSQSRVIFRHAFRNALIPTTTLFSVNFAQVLTGAIITERVFNWNGMGRLLVDSVTKIDPNVLMGWLVVVAIMVIMANLIADLVYGILDPRIRVG